MDQHSRLSSDRQTETHTHMSNPCAFVYMNADIQHKHTPHTHTNNTQHITYTIHNIYTYIPHTQNTYIHTTYIPETHTYKHTYKMDA